MPATTGITPDWLALRERADAAARAPELLAPLRERLGRAGRLVMADLGGGTGAMGRWLAPRLPGPQQWVLHDTDHGLLELAGHAPPGPALDGGPVTITARAGDLTALRAGDLAGTSLVVASALLDLLTADEVGRLADACTGAGVPALLTLTVLGRVRLTPADELDAVFGVAFNDHQRRVHRGRRLLGPDAAAAAVGAFEHRGAEVFTADSSWRLGPGDAALAAAWLRGWVGAAVEQRPELAAEARGYLRRRLAAADAGALRVVVEHRDLLAVAQAVVR
ncbi:SAM-dependent methyltransferase [Prauserella muralis]|uniref:Trans-aconitate methyltransferase n=1 Tax=Prauserella muralis TaxID=588067 RepID=A0A2V4AHG2_9PSEU|nr:SAM-dependent methyltransferase [Prauserella muralis]PXY19161.1 trans-aconitate methyltransferase [Prauserella muralis]TWE29072.1 hypothetical protein FHX69_1743 [Prauserella muralis]